MLIHRIIAPAKRHLPAPLFGALRRLGQAIFTPPFFAWATGHFRSSLANRALDRHGQLLPFYTYPAIEFLAAQDYRGRRILEWGAGYSTVWWAARASAVVAVEHDAAWIGRLRGLLPPHASLVEAPLWGAVPSLPGRFDVIVIDGMDRQRTIEPSLGLLAEDGALVVDDSEGSWGDTEDEFPIIRAATRAGLLRVDFYGFRPTVIRPGCTSVFFRPACFLMRPSAPPIRHWPAR